MVRGGVAGFEKLVGGILTFGLEFLAVFLGLLSRTVRRDLHLTLAVTSISTVPTIKALCAKTPNSLAA